MDIEAEAARDRRQIRVAVLASMAGTVALITLGVGLSVAIRFASTTRCPMPPAGITLPR